jgi:hypothetical protein
MIADRPLDEDIERAVDWFFVIGMGRFTEGRREFFRSGPQCQDLVVERAIDRLVGKLPNSTRAEVERAIKYDSLRLFGFPTNGNA